MEHKIVASVLSSDASLFRQVLMLSCLFRKEFSVDAISVPNTMATPGCTTPFIIGISSDASIWPPIQGVTFKTELIRNKPCYQSKKRIRNTFTPLQQRTRESVTKRIRKRMTQNVTLQSVTYCSINMPVWNVRVSIFLNSYTFVRCRALKMSLLLLYRKYRKFHVNTSKIGHFLDTATGSNIN